MSKAEQFLKNEKDKYGKIYVDINYAIHNVSPFLEDSVLSRRQYYSKLPFLKKYIDLIESAEMEIKNSSFFERLAENKYIDLLEDYKNDNVDYFRQLEKCSLCSCLNCIAECKFDSCLACRENSKIAQCDHNKINITKHDNFMLNLTNNNSGTNDSYVVLATLQDVLKDLKYIIVENINSREKFILHYFPGISEDTYGELSDSAEFDYIVSQFQSLDE